MLDVEVDKEAHMRNTDRMLQMLLGGAALAVVAVALGVPLGWLWPLAIVIACPLMMLLMMRAMPGMHGMHGGAEDHAGHAGHGCEHDPARTPR